MGFDNPLHIAFLLVLALLVFGAKRLPEMGRSLGEGMRGFKESINPQPPATPLSQVSTSTIGLDAPPGPQDSAAVAPATATPIGLAAKRVEDTRS
jgi:sec-independent protein translocase protein TatA